MVTSPNASTSGIGRRRAAARDESSANYRARQLEIKHAAAALFRSRGFAGTSISDIAASLGIDRASVYYYVGGKSELFDNVVSEAVRDNLTDAEAIRDGVGATPDKLRRIVESLMTSYEKHYPFLYVYIQQNLSHVADERSDWSTEMRELNRRYVSLVVDLIQDGIEEGTIAPVTEAWVMAYGLIGTVAWTNRWFNPEREPTDATTVARAYADMVLDGMLAP